MFWRRGWKSEETLSKHPLAIRGLLVSEIMFVRTRKSLCQVRETMVNGCPRLHQMYVCPVSCLLLLLIPLLSKQTLAGNGLSSSGTDLARLHTTTPGYRTLIYNRDSDHSPSEPSEPMTPPPTPPFNARTASELCKRMEGYVSFASVKGLGEPPGLDMDDNDPVEEDTQGKWGRFWRVWPFGQQHSGGSLEQDTGGFPSGR